MQDLQVSLATEQVLTGLGTYEEAPPLRPFALIGSIWLLDLLNFNFSIAVGVGFIAGGSASHLPVWIPISALTGMGLIAVYYIWHEPIE